MLCIASFAVFLLLGIFSATHRRLAAKAWYCLARKITFRPCDINFNEELKGHLLGKIVFTHPRLAKFLDRWIDWLALAFVILSLWSLFAVAIAGLNLFVYDTCDPHQAESCSLGGEACGVGTSQLTFWEGLTQGELDDWAWGHISTFGETVSRIPDRFRQWDASLVVTEDASYYYYPYDAAKSTMVEIIDPSCRFCAKQYRSIRDAWLPKTYNVTYILYPIPNPKEGGYKFPHSLKLATVITMLQGDGGGDWSFIDLLFGQKTDSGLYYFEEFAVASEEEAWILIYEMLGHVMKLDSAGEEAVRALYRPESIPWQEAEREVLEKQQRVDEVLHIQKIPTTLKDGRRYDRVIEM